MTRGGVCKASPTNIDLDWFKVMVGGMILGAVILNNYLRRLFLQVRR
ncbi:hypothetical protein TJA_23690 [Thermus sp. LT1-2-5]